MSEKSHAITRMSAAQNGSCSPDEGIDCNQCAHKLVESLATRTEIKAFARPTAPVDLANAILQLATRYFLVFGPS